ncbi:hypothetical protein Glove_406g4 [Diversispora epigaea]|uniref:Uncharacterized protein n=1 Tax=Diversispora epigaea TaxID=1348612 RepID=A0A397GZ18_9GLOM|nr:hypothetical protein Glove_406g4 [Diversispora epigaea]
MSLNIRNRSKQIQRPRPQNTYVRKSKNNIDTSDQLNDNNFDNYNEIHLSDDNNNICFLDNENNNSNNSYSSEDNNSYNNSDYDNIYLFENNNNSDYSHLFEDNNNNSDYSDLSKDDNNNNSDYSDFSEDDNNSDVEMDIEEETNFENITSLMLFTWITKHMIGNNNNSYNNSDYDNIYLFENNNNSDYSHLFEDNNNNSDYSDLSKDDNNNNSDYSDFSEDDNNSDVEMDIKKETNFENITSLMLFTWITKHMIGNSAYKDLVNIINNEDFNPIDVPKNIQTLKEQRKHLPLHKIRKNVVNINKEKTSSNSQLTKMVYSISIIDHIRTILNNLQIASRLYFGPGIETDKKSEFWHGTIWQESPLFGITSITVNRRTYNTGTSIIFKSDITLYLPPKFKIQMPKSQIPNPKLQLVFFAEIPNPKSQILVIEGYRTNNLRKYYVYYDKVKVIEGYRYQ